MSQKEVPTFKLSVTVSNPNGFSKKIYTVEKCMKFATQPTQNYPPHLKHVATLLPWDNKNCHMNFVANFISVSAVKKFWKSVKIWQSYREFKGGNVFETQCIYTVILWQAFWHISVFDQFLQCLLFVMYTFLVPFLLKLFHNITVLSCSIVIIHFDSLQSWPDVEHESEVKCSMITWLALLLHCSWGTDNC